MLRYHAPNSASTGPTAELPVPQDAFYAADRSASAPARSAKRAARVRRSFRAEEQTPELSADRRKARSDGRVGLSARVSFWPIAPIHRPAMSARRSV